MRPPARSSFFHRDSRLGVRARVTFTFGLGALALSVVMAGLTYFTARQFILNERQSTDTHQAYVNASLIRSALRSQNPNVTQLLGSLDTLPGSLSVLDRQGQWYATSPIAVGQSDLPAALRADVLAGTPALQRFGLRGTPELVVGVPVPSVQASYFEVFSLADIARTLDILALALSGAAVVTTVAGVVVGRWASGRALRPLSEVSAAAETIAGGELATRLTAGQDADLSALATSFNRMTDALQERIEREARFTSDVSHELRSPLTTLSSAVGVITSHRAELPPRSRQAVDLLGAELGRFRHMVDDLLEISRVDSGSAELSLDEVEVAELVRHAAAAAGAGDAPFEIDDTVAGQRLSVDKRRIERVVANLVANAQQYAGGVSRLALEPAPGGVRLVVADRGPGVAPAERERIFERFYRGQVSGRRGGGDGTGLGLSLVAEHVRLHGGRVWVEEGLGGENRFVVELPALHPAGDADGSPHADGAAGHEEISGRSGNGDRP